VRFLMTINGGGRQPDQRLYAEVGRLVEELTRAGVLLATGGLGSGTHDNFTTPGGACGASPPTGPSCSTIACPGSLKG
jgi:hypothetical protein